MFDCKLCLHPYPYLKTQVGQILPFKPLKGIGLGLLSIFLFHERILYVSSFLYIEFLVAGR